MLQVQPHVLSLFKTLSTMNKWSAYILSVLENSEATSTEISRRIVKMTNGDVMIYPGSINDSAKHLLREGLIEFTEASRGKLYRITPRGKEMLARLYRLSNALKTMQSPFETSS